LFFFYKAKDLSAFIHCYAFMTFNMPKVYSLLTEKTLTEFVIRQRSVTSSESSAGMGDMGRAVMGEGAYAKY
jgi:hypothetical protein